jgi:GNAT superfamily N-acetyltransferase
MECHIAALFTTDAAGQLLRVREHNGGPAPRFFLGRSARHSIYRFRVDVPKGVRRELAAAVTGWPPGVSTTDPEGTAREQLARLAAILGNSAPVETMSAGPAYAFPYALPLLAADSGRVVRVTEDNISVLEPALRAWIPDVIHSPPLMALVLGDHAVAVCGSVRITAPAHEAGVETAPSHRGQGYAPRVVAAWAERVRALGAEPLYSTSWQNAASRAVARKLALAQVCDDLHLT